MGFLMLGLVFVFTSLGIGLIAIIALAVIASTEKE
jgi:hypothetical protein